MTERENGDRFSEFSKVYRGERKIFPSPWQDLALLDHLSWEALIEDTKAQTLGLGR